jgi:hypothetical protein
MTVELYIYIYIKKKALQMSYNGDRLTAELINQ